MESNQSQEEEDGNLNDNLELLESHQDSWIFETIRASILPKNFTSDSSFDASNSLNKQDSYPIVDTIRRHTSRDQLELVQDLLQTPISQETQEERNLQDENPMNSALNEMDSSSCSQPWMNDFKESDETPSTSSPLSGILESSTSTINWTAIQDALHNMNILNSDQNPSTPSKDTKTREREPVSVFVDSKQGSESHTFQRLNLSDKYKLGKTLSLKRNVTKPKESVHSPSYVKPLESSFYESDLLNLKQEHSLRFQEMKRLLEMYSKYATLL